MRSGATGTRVQRVRRVPGTNWCRSTFLVLVLSAGLGILASGVTMAQTAPEPFARIQSQLKRGQRVEIWSGESQVVGKLTNVSPSDIVVDVNGESRRLT